MRSVLAGLRTLILPWGAGPNSPAVVLGETIPAELQTFYTTTTGLGPVIAVKIMRVDAVTYVYEALVNQGSLLPLMCVGTVSGTDVTELYQIKDARMEFDTLPESFFPCQYEFGRGDGVFPIGQGGYVSLLADVDWKLDTISAPRGYRIRDVFSGANVNTTGAEAIIGTSDTMNFLQDRAYRIGMACLVESATSAVYVLRLRTVNAAGQILLQFGDNSRGGAGASRYEQREVIVRNSSGGDISKAVVLTGAGGTGANPMIYSHASTAPRTVTVEDIGAAANFTDYLALT